MWQATRDTKSFRKFQTTCSSSDNEWDSPSMCYRKADTKGKRSNKGDWRRMPPESSSPTDVTMVLWTSTHYNWDYLLNANIPFKTIGSERAKSFYTSVQFSSVAQLWLSLCDPRNCSMPGFPLHHHLLEFTQTHVYWVSDATQPSHPLLSPSLPTFNLSQHQGLFKWVSSLHQVPKILELQHQSLQWIFRTDFL